MTDKAKGKMKEAAGAITGDEEKKAEGQAQQRAAEAAEEAGQKEKVRQEEAKAKEAERERDKQEWVCPVFTDCLPLSHSASFHSSLLALRGAQMPQRGMPPSGVVEALDVLEDRRPRYLTARPGVAVDQLPL
jgi:uncharacterized protein YjbJ (UPF0337 family)